MRNLFLLLLICMTNAAQAADIPAEVLQRIQGGGSPQAQLQLQQLAQPQTPPTPPGLGAVFAFPGNACPVSSEEFKGPEAQMIKESGAVYCVFRRSIIAIPKAKLPDGKCPGASKPYVNSKFKPDADTIWCERPPLPEGVKPNTPQ